MASKKTLPKSTRTLRTKLTPPGYYTDAAIRQRAEDKLKAAHDKVNAFKTAAAKSRGPVIKKEQGVAKTPSPKKKYTSTRKPVTKKKSTVKKKCDTQKKSATIKKKPATKKLTTIKKEPIIKSGRVTKSKSKSVPEKRLISRKGETSGDQAT